MLASLPGMIRLEDASNPASSSIPGRYGWWLAPPGLEGGRQWYDLTGRTPGVLAGMTATSGWRGTTRPGGWSHVQFDGSDDVATLIPTSPANASVLSGSGSYTLACWVRCGTTSANYPGVLGWGIVSSTHGFGILQSPGASGNLYAVLVDSANNVSANLPALAGLDGKWHHLATTVDRGTGKLSIYLDAVLAAATTIAAGSISTSQALLAGRRDTFYWAGGLDDIAFATRAWTAVEVAANFEESRSGYPTALPRSRPAVSLISGPAAASNPLTVAATFPALSVAATLASTNPAAVAATFPPLSASATLTQSNPISIAASFPALAASAVLSSANPVNVAASFPALTAAASLTQTNPLTIAASFPPIAASVALSQGSSLAVAATFPPLAVFASLASTNPVAVAASFPPLSAAVVLGQGSSLVVAATFPGLTASAVLASANPLTVAASFPRLAVSASLENGTPAIDPGGCWPWDWWYSGGELPSDLLAAIVARFLNDPELVAAFPGGIHRDESDNDEDGPFPDTLIFSVLSTKTAKNMRRGSYHDVVDLRFTAYSLDGDRAEELGDLVTCRYDEAPLEFEKGYLMSFQLTGGGSPPVPGRTRNNERLFARMANFRAKVGRNRP